MFVVGRDFSVLALKIALASDRRVFLAAQHDASVDEPKIDEIFEVGTIAKIVHDVKVPDENVKITVEGLERAVVIKVSSAKGYFEATVSTMNEAPKMTPALDATIQRVQNLLDKHEKLCQSAGQNPLLVTRNVSDPSRLSDLIAQSLPLELEEKQNLLEIFDPVKRLDLVAELLADEIMNLQKEGPH